MNIGMLWFDNDPKADLKIKIERAATYYRSKYGKAPNLCFVNPIMLETSPTRATGINSTKPVGTPQPFLDWDLFKWRSIKNIGLT